ncbi:uncharacterized protein LY79DRAFT_671254 [Colletotrichum navitas]|uniref:Uncharacterized protein n=1 Tax=Colletotrichum navitas TaxID=681940 RepID=A0AAD8PWL5_9PEZI|nr:uncharacterized protein LY79DRAFT_671254 [Colletotrichum navitas]KAK1585153.1 hypothetical protein LY79DRAFT_671254 [Colletotrichum navitas]
MPPHEAYHARLSPRSAESDRSRVSYLAPFAVGTSVALFLAFLITIALWRRDVFKARSENREMLKSLTLTKQQLAEAIELHEKQSRYIRQLHNISSRYVVEHGPLPLAVLEQVAAEVGQVPEGNPSPENGDEFVVSDDEEWENETRARESLVSDDSRVETDPAAPRIATIGVMRTAAWLQGPEPERLHELPKAP